MAHFTPFPVRPPLPSLQLPLTLVALDDWGLVILTGEDRFRYLQGQLTADVNQLQPDRHVLCAHCDAKGKVWSSLRLFHLHQESGLAFIARRSVLAGQLSELKKYALFSKVSIVQDSQSVLLGIAGSQARETLAALFDKIPTARHPVVQHADGTLLHFTLPAERFLLLTSAAHAGYVLQKTGDTAQRNNSQQWLALDIEAGYPVIDGVNSAKLIPQALNLQALEGISFSKGCYVGQEMVARAKYRGANKRALYWLAGMADRVPAAGEDLEWQLGSNWRRTGLILAASRLQDGTVWVQAVLNNDLSADAVLRVRDDTGSKLTIQSLPYKLA